MFRKKIHLSENKYVLCYDDKIILEEKKNSEQKKEITIKKNSDCFKIKDSPLLICTKAAPKVSARRNAITNQPLAGESLLLDDNLNIIKTIPMYLNPPACLLKNNTLVSLSGAALVIINLHNLNSQVLYLSGLPRELIPLASTSFVLLHYGRSRFIDIDSKAPLSLNFFNSGLVLHAAPYDDKHFLVANKIKDNQCNFTLVNLSNLESIKESKAYDISNINNLYLLPDKKTFLVRDNQTFYLININEDQLVCEKQNILISGIKDCVILNNKVYIIVDDNELIDFEQILSQKKEKNSTLTGLKFFPPPLNHLIVDYAGDERFYPQVAYKK